ncbi:MAG: 16S rRNA (adenine(1518)-N(6)/adenine(1519)-N(6))-dimethyltransferase RsmA [Holosporaceae bacterium]|jgi:16S rRNA (adenine1518-N6/adenine1519-N6)-dimethyltransferase|nr:16S rRNA (adenine(1518)-N(6)/adenine(1519)-N(6))-dimethyltransferase RsmA [Holosporaceae bacterium]
MDREPNFSADLQNISAKQIFNKFHGKIEKKFGQHFLFDKQINHKILSTAGDITDKTIVEIGPGPGGLTLEILKQNIKKLYVVEIDHQWATVWKNLEFLFKGKLSTIECDALAFDMRKISPNIIISNLPYNISTQLLCKWLVNFDMYDQLVLVFQKEVADRLYAVPCTKAYGKLSVLAQWKSQVSKMFDLEAGSFFPIPDVKSTVVKFTPFKLSKHQSIEKHKIFSNLLIQVFSQRRKIVAKSLGKFFENPEQVLKELGYDKNTRAEQISVSDYIKMLDLSIRKEKVFV